MIDPMNDAEVERMARAIYEELVANRHWDDVPLGDRDDFVHLLRRAMLSARPALSDGPRDVITSFFPSEQVDVITSPTALPTPPTETER